MLRIMSKSKGLEHTAPLVGGGVGVVLHVHLDGGVRSAS